MSRKQKHNNESINTDNINFNEFLKNISVNNVSCVEKSCDIIKALANENDLFREEAYGYKYVSDELKIKNKKYVDEITQLKNQLILYEQQRGGMSDNIQNIIKSYSMGLSDERKKEIREKYKKFID